MSEPLLNAKELAALLRKSRSYIFAMKARGFIMPGGTATLTEARVWLSRNPPPRSKNEAVRLRETLRNTEAVDTANESRNVAVCQSAPPTSATSCEASNGMRTTRAFLSRQR